ncbi:MAG: hypothetical protein M3295_02710 [Chloroflexota bacterium]|nr:hypothetical protein [Chloroflexota bacterium]
MLRDEVRDLRLRVTPEMVAGRLTERRHRSRSAMLAVPPIAAVAAAAVLFLVLREIPRDAGRASPAASAPAAAAQTATPDLPPSVETDAEAAALVLASNDEFRGIAPQSPYQPANRGSFYTASQTREGFRVEVHRGWGDCPSGCIHEHTWRYLVDQSGRIELLDQAGDPLSGADYEPPPPAGSAPVELSGTVRAGPCQPGDEYGSWNSAECAAGLVPGASVQLLDAHGAFMDATTTGYFSGRYRFDGVRPGVYIVDPAPTVGAEEAPPVAISVASLGATVDFFYRSMEPYPIGPAANVLADEVSVWDIPAIGDPESPSHVVATLTRGASVYVVDGPVSNSGRLWFKVSPIEGSFDAGWLVPYSRESGLAVELPTAEPAVFEWLARPLELPSIAPGEACPVSPSADVSQSVGPAIGSGPLRPSQPSVVRVREMGGDGRQPGDPLLLRPIWISLATYDGPALIRGAQLDGPGRLTFGPPDADDAELALPAISSVHAPRQEAGVRMWPVYLLVPGAGCYGYQIEGVDFTSVAIFEVTDE